MSNVKGNDKKVFVGLSGGVDSSVSAYLLQKEGFDVTGVFIHVWYPDFIECNWKEERRDAMRVCARLNIPFRELDLSDVYKREVIDYMISEYREGRTPNPDVMCNRSVKFGAFLDWAREQGADYVATGHYARVERDEHHDEVALHVGVDANKDQSYFLWTLRQDQLRHILFPVGHLEKREVREIAARRSLHTATKKDSQGLCFLGHVDIKEFLRHFIQTEKGDVLDESGERIGFHDGAVLYTIGERRGFTITKKTPEDRPFYVIAKNVDENTITVSHAKSEEPVVRNARVLRLKDLNWITGDPSEGKYKARIRYRQVLQEVEMRKEKNSAWTLIFDESQPSVAVGQSAVLYNGEQCCGGGIIDEVIE